MRMRFKKDEREAFKPGVAIEWRNGSHWHPGIVTGEIFRSDGGWDNVMIRHTGRNTATLHTGQAITGTPTHLRVPQGI